MAKKVLLKKSVASKLVSKKPASISNVSGTIPRKDLLNALLFVKPGIATKNAIESMKYFYFSGTSIVSYNDTISIAYPFKTTFSAFIEADKLFKVVSKLDSDTISFHMEGETLKMSSGKVNTSFSSITDKDVIDRINTVQESLKGEKRKTLPSNFTECISLCSQVAAIGDSAGTLNCLYVNGVDIISSDNVRIAHAVLKSKMDEMLILASEIKSLISIEPEWYILTKSWIHFISQNGCLYSIRTTKGDYPDMLQFTKFTGVKITLPETLIKGVDLASIFTDDTDPSINVTIKNNVCRIFKKSQGGNIDFKESIDYPSDKEINFNIIHQLLREMMSHSTDIILSDSKSKLHNGGFTLVTTFYTN